MQLDGANSQVIRFIIAALKLDVQGEERVLVVGATNRPQELDEAARRR